MGKQTDSSADVGQADTGTIGATGVYNDDGAVVLYDTENPLAWIEGDNAIEVAQHR
ncbi:MAG: hypothetical protein V5A55_09725 [Halovenus sp.]